MTASSITLRALRALSMVAVTGVCACSEPVSAPAGHGVDAGRRSGRATQRDTQTQTGTTTGTETQATTTTTGFIRFASWAPPLATYDTSFVVVVGRATTFIVMFRDYPLPFMQVTIPANADFFGADGLVLPNGTSVTVTVAIDPVTASVRFGPHGTRFTAVPARLYLNYFFLDFGGQIPSALAIWYQPDSTSPWVLQATDVDVVAWWLVTDLHHFSNYAVAYRR